MVPVRCHLIFIVVMVYYQISPKVLFRNYGDFGYLTDNRNFGYKFSGNDFVLGDQIVSEGGVRIYFLVSKSALFRLQKSCTG